MVAEYRALWNVPGGGSGYSTFYADGVENATQALAMATAVRSFFAELLVVLPSDVSVAFESEVRILDMNTGALTGAFAITAPASVSGSNGSAYAAGAGGRVDWLTLGIANGRRVRGRTYVVPLVGFEPDGTLSTASITALTDAADAYRTAMGAGTLFPVVWHRPVNGAGGSVHDITGASIPDKSALLRSRRD